MLYAVLGFFAFPSFFYVLNIGYEIYGDWRYKKSHYKLCPTCGTYVLNLKVS